jgi:hypothetical protein
MKLPLIPTDKANHIVYGFVIYFIANLFLNPFSSLGVVLLFALGKEVLDQINYKGFDYKDLAVTMIIPVVLFLKTLIN